MLNYSFKLMDNFGLLQLASYFLIFWEHLKSLAEQETQQPGD